MRKYRKDVALLLEAKAHWESMAGYRSCRERCKRYCYGDQWGDYVQMDGRWVREEQYIRSQGSEPLKNNLIRRLVKQVLGLYRSESHPPKVSSSHKASSRLMERMLSEIHLANCSDEIDSRAFEEFLVSGMVVQRKSYGVRRGLSGCWTDNVSPDNFFVDREMCDCRGWDVECLGEIHDMCFEKICEEFAHIRGDIRALAAVYRLEDYGDRLDEMLTAAGCNAREGEPFLCPHSERLCRVYEVWRLERRAGLLSHDRAAGRLSWHSADAGGGEGVWAVAASWHYYFLTPFGDVLAEGVSPYRHLGHPYVFKAYPFVDGEIHSFVADVIDQQRYTNRLITLYDWVMRSSAKGVLIVPEECVPEGYTVDDVARQWSRFNGVIPVSTKNGALLPQQVSANAVNVGINELLQTQLGLMEDISGVTGALQGKLSAPSASGKLYEQQTKNATLSQLDLLDTFRHFIAEGVRKEVSVIQQYCIPEELGQSPSEEVVSAFREAHFTVR